METGIIRPNYPAEVETRYLNLPGGRGIFVACEPQTPPFGQRWAEDGACRREDREGFVPKKQTPVAKRQEAKAACMTCPVNHHCLEEALAHPSKLTGLWCGTDQEDRSVIRRARPQEVTRALDAVELGAAIIDIMNLVG